MKEILSKWFEMYRQKKNKNRINAYMRNHMYRYKLKALYTEWRKVAFCKFLEQLRAQEKKKYAEESKVLLDSFSSQVDALILYTVQLKGRISNESDEIKKLSSDYEKSYAIGA